eukprot:TRINITY_DN287_c1_g1_i11.p2 TRINITY_DN287_c1_g1~~TRINITY_DN287_c1_g1_i11.p2  ORF type:complete len:352 (-),score=67.02 TRINITY_DN287_c1_g1_i11:3937-4992(-)
MTFPAFHSAAQFGGFPASTGFGSAPQYSGFGPGFSGFPQTTFAQPSALGASSQTFGASPGFTPAGFPATFGSPFAPQAPRGFSQPTSFPPAAPQQPPQPPQVPQAPQAPQTQGHIAPRGDAAPQHDTGGVCWHLIYWGCRGLGAHIRMLLHYADAHYDETIIKKFEDWFGSEGEPGLKARLLEDNPLANLPSFEDGAVVLSQSSSILRHVARKLGLYGCSEVTTAKCDMLLDECADLRTSWTRMMYGPKDQFDEARAKHFAETVKRSFGKLADWLAANGKSFFVEDHPTAPDFVIWELLDIHALAEPGCLDAYPTLQEYHARVRALPRLQRYFESELASMPPNGATANWNL